MLRPADPLPHTARRILVTGTSGSGKSTLRQRISEALRYPTVEVDSLYHGPDWTVRPTFEEDVNRFSAGPAWVVEWQYSTVKALLLSRSDVLVWLDHSRWTVAHRLVRRTTARRIRRQQLWNGNYEPPLWTFFSNRDHIVRWGWRTHRRRADEAREVAARPDGPVVVRLRGQRQVDEWVNGSLAALAAEVRSGG
jgi:adenylate kinase family enzyme